MTKRIETNAYDSLKTLYKVFFSALSVTFKLTIWKRKKNVWYFVTLKESICEPNLDNEVCNDCLISVFYINET